MRYVGLAVKGFAGLALARPAIRGPYVFLFRGSQCLDTRISSSERPFNLGLRVRIGIGHIHSLQSHGRPPDQAAGRSQVQAKRALSKGASTLPPRQKADAKPVRWSKSSRPKGNLVLGTQRPSKPERHSLSAAQISSIFGSGIGTTLGNRILKTVQRQRVDGRLDEDVGEAGVDDAAKASALAWLRQHRPFDEHAAVVQRVEREESEVEKRQLQEIKAAEDWKPQDRAKVEGIYGPSVLEDLHEEMQRRRAEKARVEADRPKTSVPSHVQKLSERAITDRRKESAEWREKYRERGQIIKQFEPEKISTRQRLLPCAAFTAGFIGLCILYARYYQRPESMPRLLPSISPATATMLAIVGANVGLFLAWKFPPAWRKMNQYFLVVVALPKPLSLLGSTFSHQTFLHLLVNMAFLGVVGTSLHGQIGRENFVPLYLSCGVFASFVSLGRAVILRDMFQTSLGASGSMTGIIAAWLCLNPFAKFTFAFLPEDKSPTMLSSAALACLITLEFANIWKGVVLVDHVAHLAGYLAGIVGAQLLKSRKRRLQKERP